MFLDGKRMKGKVPLNHHGKVLPRSLEACLIRERPTVGNRAPGGDWGFWAAVGGGAQA